MSDRFTWDFPSTEPKSHESTPSAGEACHTATIHLNHSHVGMRHRNQDVSGSAVDSSSRAISITVRAEASWFNSSAASWQHN